MSHIKSILHETINKNRRLLKYLRHLPSYQKNPNPVITSTSTPASLNVPLSQGELGQSSSGKVLKDFHLEQEGSGESDLFLIKKIMASLLLPMFATPPSTLPSPMMDDISALREQRQESESPPGSISPPPEEEEEVQEQEDRLKKIQGPKGRFMLRRKLSTSFDDPQTSQILSLVASRHFHTCKGAEGSSNSNSNSPAAEIRGPPSWLDGRFRGDEMRISECSEADSGTSSGGGGEGDNRTWSIGSGGSVKEDIFQLLEKCIGFKARNVSHISVEQCVKDLCTVYSDLDDAEKLKFFSELGANYGVDHSSIAALATSLGTCQDEQTKLNMEEKLRSALIPKYQWLFSQVGRLDNGVKFLVDLRTDILDAIEKSNESTTLLKPLNTCLKELIGVWFGIGFLKLERVTWMSPCEMLQKISEYEAVHPVRGLSDLKKRVGPNRRCFVFTHGSMPAEPVVVLHTALTNHIPASIHKIVTKKRMMSLDNESDSKPTIAEEVEDHDFIDTAIFYSISSTQKGLTGIELGNYLIKRVVRELQIEFPKMQQFSTLSPIPGFRNWLMTSLKGCQRDPNNQELFTAAEIQQLSPIFKKKYPDQDFFEAIMSALKLNSWYSDNELSTVLENPLMRLCAQYLYLTKRRGYALDPVAHFHLKNGAVMWRINWNGDASARGLTNSCGIMVNYRYFLDDCEKNSQTYLEQQVIPSSDQVLMLANTKLTDPSLGSKKV